jgi:hypothetical protein
MPRLQTICNWIRYVHYLAPRTQPLLRHSIPPHAHQHQHSTTDRPTPDADADPLVRKQPTNGTNAFDSQDESVSVGSYAGARFQGGNGSASRDEER